VTCEKAVRLQECIVCDLEAVWVGTAGDPRNLSGARERVLIFGRYMRN
jgi:hypothetical protein